MIKNICIVETYNDPPVDYIELNSHDNDTNLVEIVIGNSTYNVYGSDLIAATKNCMRVI